MAATHTRADSPTVFFSDIDCLGNPRSVEYTGPSGSPQGFSRGPGPILTLPSGFGYKLTSMTPSTADRSLVDCDPRYRETVLQMLRSQAWRELSAAQLFGHALQYVPDLRSLKFISRHIVEETEHYAAVADLYQKHLGESLEPWVSAKLATNPIPWASSFLE